MYGSFYMVKNFGSGLFRFVTMYAFQIERRQQDRAYAFALAVAH